MAFIIMSLGETSLQHFKYAMFYPASPTGTPSVEATALVALIVLRDLYVFHTHSPYPFAGRFCPNSTLAAWEA